MRISQEAKRSIIFGFAILIVALLYAFKNTSFLLRVCSTIAALLAFYAFDYLFEIDFHLRHYVFMIIIVITGFLFSPGYYIYPNYDKILHFVQPIFLCSLLFFIIDKLQLKFKWKLVFTFVTALSFLALFEISEFWLDYFFNLKLQGVFLRSLQGLEKYDLILDSNTDTMIDLMLGTLGSLTYIGARWFAYGGRHVNRLRKSRST